MANAYDEVLPHIGDQLAIFSQLLDSISYCESLGSSAWSLTFLDNGFRLNVGPIEAMTCRFAHWAAGEAENDHDVTFVNVRLLLAGADCLNVLGGEGQIKEMSYGSVGEKCWCYFGAFLPASGDTPDPIRLATEEHLSRLRENHRRFLKLACHTPTGKLRQKSNFAQHHCEGLFAYAQQVVGASQLAQT
ncbi:hypothetical protein [Variovorax brevis]|uniref:hypothetical protein n=1 Tax=Variovorax brevis TaxID=3053503 RepID=UPI002577D135|nr:hypothetical protein [Variovorax sp. J22R133]